MKNITVILFFASGLISCHDNNTKTSILPDNSFTSKRSGVDWNGATEIRTDSKTDTLTLLFTANRPNDEVVVMKIKFDGVSSYTLMKNQSYYRSTIGGDVLTSEYNLGLTDSGQLVISKYDSTENIIEGNFEISFKKKWSYPDTNADVLNFTNGKFKGKISN